MYRDRELDKFGLILFILFSKNSQIFPQGDTVEHQQSGTFAKSSFNLELSSIIQSERMSTIVVCILHIVLILLLNLFFWQISRCEDNTE